MDHFYNTVGVIGAGSFGSVIAEIAAENVEQVLVFVRSEKRLINFNERKENNGFPVSSNVIATNSIEEITSKCKLLFAMVPSKSFGSMIQDFSPYLSPDQIMIHGTKGLDVKLPHGISSLSELEEIGRESLSTMSELVAAQTPIKRVGCLAGPNLSAELQEKQPSGAIVASLFNEVIQLGYETLNSERFKVFNSYDILGAEFAGILKNIFAIASGILTGLGLGNNARALLITKGLHEMLFLGKHLGADSSAFLGIAGIGDLVATCSSPLSRNFTVGRRIAVGESLDHISDDMSEVAEGVRSVQIFTAYCKKNNITAPFTEMLYKVLFEGKPSQDAIRELMNYRYAVDVDFL